MLTLQILHRYRKPNICNLAAEGISYSTSTLQRFLQHAREKKNEASHSYASFTRKVIAFESFQASKGATLFCKAHRYVTLFEEKITHRLASAFVHPRDFRQ